VNWIFGRRPAPVPEPVMNLADVAVKTAWGLTVTQWLALTDSERAHLRNAVTHARKAS
jgi:hypothetical protein